MADSPLKLRDFIYLDIDRMYSLYSQVFGGVTGHVVESRINTLGHGNSQSANPFRGKQSLENVSEELSSTETRVLLDHLYNQLEERIGPAITAAETIAVENWGDTLRKSFLVKVRGQANIEDYAMLKSTVQNYNRIGAGLAYLALQTSDTKALKEATEREWRSAKVPAVKAQLKKQLDILSSPEKFAEANNLKFEQKHLDSLAAFFDVYDPNRFEIVIGATDCPAPLIYRGVIDTKWLRLQPEALRSLYNGFVISEWTMVGQVTLIQPIPSSQNVAVPQEEQDVANTSETETSSAESVSELVDEILAPHVENPNQEVISSIRDELRDLFFHVNEATGILTRSNRLIEVLFRPLAIYQETIIDTTNIAPTAE